MSKPYNELYEKLENILAFIQCYVLNTKKACHKGIITKYQISSNRHVIVYSGKKYQICTQISIKHTF